MIRALQEPFLVQTNWSEFHFDADGTRLNPYENVLNARTVQHIDLKWSYPTKMQSSPAVANALDARTGLKLWSYNTGYYMQSSPAVANGVVYVGSTDGNFYALNASTGDLKWRSLTGAPVNSCSRGRRSLCWLQPLPVRSGCHYWGAALVLHHWRR